MNDFIIEQLTKKYIKAYEQEKNEDTKIYVRKTTALKELIELFKKHNIANEKTK